MPQRKQPVVVNNHHDVAQEDNTFTKDEDDSETRCGAFGLSPSWLQVLASKKTYVLVYGFLGMNQSAIGSYFIGTLSTIEKRFKISSTQSGLIASAWDIGALCSSMIMAYFGGTGHKTRWVAIGAIFAAISCFIRYTPHALYGPGEPYTSNFSSKHLCTLNRPPEECDQGTEAHTTFLILFMTNIALGIGTCTYYTLGVAYLDDNALKNKIPFLFALSTSLRGVGPTLGFLLSSYTLSIYIHRDIKPAFEKQDSRWVGAWYYGWIPLGIVHLFFAFIMSTFPRTLPREAMRRKSSVAHWAHQKTKKSLADFLVTMKRLVKNPVLMFNSFSSTFYIFGMMAYWIFMPKYMEFQFGISASKASFVTGIVGVVCMGFGVLTSGFIVSKFRPRPRYLAAWNVFTETIDTVGHFLFAFIVCPKSNIEGRFDSTGVWNLTTECNTGCECPESLQYIPVCASDNVTSFYSPCHAGCISSQILNGVKIYTNCSCIGGDDSWAKEGRCDFDCNTQFIVFLILLSVMKFLSSTGRAGNLIIQFRSVNPTDKSVSIALTEALLCIVAFIPAPILYGRIVDFSCLLWGSKCGERGNCWLYDDSILRYLLNVTASSFLLIATILDIGVFYNVKNLQIYDEEEDKQGNKIEVEKLKKDEGNHVGNSTMKQEENRSIEQSLDTKPELDNHVDNDAVKRDDALEDDDRRWLESPLLPKNNSEGTDKIS